jgi:malate dehydrogenase
MSVAAILGAGPIGGAIAHALAKRAAFREIRLIDAAAGVAEGKALDIRQSGPVEHFDTVLSGSADVLSACGASVIIVADAVTLGEWEGETGLALVRQLMRAGTSAPFVFAGVKQTWLMEAAAREIGIARDRLVGAAPAALVGAVRALAAAEIDGSPKDVAVSVVGRPPAFVVAWSAATVAGRALAERIAPHRLRAISQAVRALWPTGPQAIAAVTAEVAAGLAFGARRQLPAMTVLDGEFGIRGVAALLPLELGGGRVTRRFVPTLSAQERVEFQNALEPARA